MDIRDYYKPETVLKQDYHKTLAAIENNSKHVNYFRDGYAIYYHPDSIDGFIDGLFNRLIDRCITNGFYDIHNSLVPIINPELRESFEQLINYFT